MHLCNTSVVKIGTAERNAAGNAALAEHSYTSDQWNVTAAAARVAQVVMNLGPSNAAAIAATLHTSVAAVNKHLDVLETAGWVSSGARAPFGPAAVLADRRGRGRPPRVWALTDIGAAHLAERESGQDGCAAVAAAAVDAVSELGGESAVRSLALRYADSLSAQWLNDGIDSVETLAQSLSRQGYAAVVSNGADGGVQLCQHHCPIADVATAHPQFCEAETAAISAVLGRNVVRLSSIASGGALCTTLIPGARPQSISEQPTSNTVNGDAQ